MVGVRYALPTAFPPRPGSLSVALWKATTCIWLMLAHVPPRACDRNGNALQYP
ncbi:hypothetical protein PIIN_10746 [Serendipita indica DSM 11827]|uniref:Uncharacterized protein n=1 Tax=Serendipita indica (strain DSM 11827) TaxID=1109443 RepID=G4TZL5_SERID|nr:hypothetical protein PIIN_10746 [Serendipita indica DSM 11827]